MRRVLALAYHFPPVGGGGVQRTLKFVRTCRSSAGSRSSSPARAMPGGGGRPQTPRSATRFLRIWRSSASAASLPLRGRNRRRVDRWLGRGGPFRRWWIDGVTRAGAAVGDVDLVYASMSPFEGGEAAAALARSLACPWVADLRDPWALDEVAVYPTRFHRARELRRMRHVLARADAVIMNTPEATRQLLARFPEIDPGQVHTIPNGFDREDFDDPEPPPDDATFRIVHAGYLHTELGEKLRRGHRVRRLLGGFEVDVDLVTRSHVYLLAAVQRVIESHADTLPIEVHLAGVASDHDRAAGEAGFVKYLGYLPHTESVALVRSADLLFLPMHDLPAGHRATIVPGKTYEYLASGRPILAAVPNGDAHELLGEAATAHLCRPADTAAMADVIGDLVRRRAVGRTPTERPDVVAPFERRLLTERLVATFDSVAGQRLHPQLGAAA